MAKADDVSFFEKHVEKIVLVVCLLILAYTTLQSVISSPREVRIVQPSGMGDQALSPDQVDQKLLAAATTIESRIKNFPPPKHTLPKWMENVRDLQDRSIPKIAAVDVGVATRPLDIPPVGPPPPDVSLAGLRKELRAPGKPAIWAGYVLPKALPGDDKPNDVVAVTGAVVFPAKQIRTKWGEQLRDIKAKPIIAIVGVEVDILERKEDGTWPAKGRPLKTVANLEEPAPAIPAYDGSNAEAVQKAMEAAAGAEILGKVIQPEFWDIWIAKARAWGSWKVNLPKTPLAGKTLDQLIDEGGDLLVWFHDVSPISGKQYKYRVRLVLINPLLSYNAALAKEFKADGDVTTITTDWSPPSDPVSVRKETKFFLAGASDLTGSVRVSVYTQRLGQWANKAFPVTPGQSIGGKVAIPLTHPATGKVEKVTVDFSTGATAVDLDFTRQIPSGRFPKKTTAMVYLDENGNLQTRILDDDKKKERNWQTQLKAPPPAKAGETGAKIP